MKLETHRAALRAAAKVAFSVALIGCGGSTTSGTTGANEGTQPAAANGSSGGQSRQGGGQGSGSSDESTSNGDAAALVDSSRPANEAGTQSCLSLTDLSEKEACCDNVAQEALADAGFPVHLDASAEVTACCQVLAERQDRIWQDPDAGWDTSSWPRGQCCAVLNWQGSMACTPWGPPTPPAMKGAQRKLEAVA
jgi:hypothetical protein